MSVLDDVLNDGTLLHTPEIEEQFFAEIERLKADAKESQGWYEAEIERLKADNLSWQDWCLKYQIQAGEAETRIREKEAEIERLAKLVEAPEEVEVMPEQWEEVADDPWTLRLPVPGGWLYNVVALTENRRPYTNSTVFVPAPDGLEKS